MLRVGRVRAGERGVGVWAECDTWVRRSNGSLALFRRRFEWKRNPMKRASSSSSSSSTGWWAGTSSSDTSQLARIQKGRNFCRKFSLKEQVQVWALALAEPMPCQPSPWPQKCGWHVPCALGDKKGSWFCQGGGVSLMKHFVRPWDRLPSCLRGVRGCWLVLLRALSVF